jgi:hypothetical protein
MFLLLANTLSTFFVNVVKLFRVWQFGLGFTCNIRVMQISIIHVCRSMSNGGVFYKKGFETLFLIMCKQSFHEKFTNSLRCMGVTFSTFALLQSRTLWWFFFYYVLCRMQHWISQVSILLILGLFNFWTMFNGVVAQINVIKYNLICHFLWLL